MNENNNINDKFIITTDIASANRLRNLNFVEIPSTSNNIFTFLNTNKEKMFFNDMNLKNIKFSNKLFF